MVEKKEDSKLKGIKNAQDRKDFAIAYFNATNNAIQMFQQQSYDVNKVGDEYAEKFIVKWRDWFLKEHLSYRARVTEKVGASYNPSSVLEAIEATKNIDELKMLFLGLTQDERSDKDVNLSFQKKKLEHETIQRD